MKEFASPLAQEDYVRALIAANEKLVADAARARDVAGQANDAESQDLVIGQGRNWFSQVDVARGDVFDRPSLAAMAGAIARPLIEGLHNEVVVRDDRARTLFPEIDGFEQVATGVGEDHDVVRACGRRGAPSRPGHSGAGGARSRRRLAGNPATPRQSAGHQPAQPETPRRSRAVGSRRRSGRRRDRGRAPARAQRPEASRRRAGTCRADCCCQSRRECASRWRLGLPR